MELVLGVSMAPTTIRMVLVEGENADGVMVEEDNIDVIAADDSPTCRASDQVIAAILGTREGATAAGSQLLSTGVTWTDQKEAAALRDALAARKVENVMLVSAFLAAAALAQTVGQSVGYQHTAMLFVEPQNATLAVVDSADGSITDVHRRPLRVGEHGGDAVIELLGMLARLSVLESRPEGVFVVGSGVDIAAIKPRLEAATRLPVSAPEEPETALARGAALASANAPLFASSTAALAYAQDPGTGVVDPYAVAPGYLKVPEVAPGTELGEEDLAYSAVPDEDADALTVVLDSADDSYAEARRQSRPLLLAGTALATLFVAGALALVVSLAISIRPTVALRPNPGQELIVPTAQPPPPPAAETPAQPQSIPAPVVQPAPAHAVVAPPLNAPAPVAPPLPAAPVPASIPAAPPVPAPVPAAPVPVPIPIPVRVPVPQPQAQLPAPRPVQLPAPQPIQLPSPQPVQLPSPQPVRVPNPPVRVPNPPVQKPVPQPPVRLPASQPPVNLPAPEPPAHLPAPQPPINLPAPEPPAHLPAHQPPVNFPEPEPPQANLPAPEPPMRLPAPEAPSFPVMPAPQAPAFPVMPAPAAPPMPAMPFPAAPVPVMPHLPVIAPHFRF